MSWWTQDRISYAVNYLIGNGGLTPYGAAGLVSRWVNVESSGGPASVNPFSGAFGIGQWLGARKAPINGNTDFNSQLAYVVQELNGSEARAGNQLRSAGDAYSGALGASMYERAEGYNPGTGADNYTQKTANGIGAVLAAANSAGAVTDNTSTDTGSLWNLGAISEDISGGLGTGAIVALAVGALALFLLLQD